MFFLFQEALLTTPITHSGRPKVVPRSSRCRCKRTFWSFGAPVFGGMSQSFRRFSFFYVLGLSCALSKSTTPIADWGVARAICFSWCAWSLRRRSVLCFFCFARFCCMLFFDDPYRRSVAFVSQHVASKSILAAPAQCFMIVYNSIFSLEKDQCPKT